MLSDLLPLMTGTIQHWRENSYNLFGKPIDDRSYTEHRARVVRTPGVETEAGSGQQLATFAATVWLIDHPRPVRVGDMFSLAPSGEALKVARIEMREISPSTLTKVFLK